MRTSEFDTWEEARAAAQDYADWIGLSVGIEKPTAYQRWTIKLLPAPQNRSGWELRCEVVDPVEHARARRWVAGYNAGGGYVRACGGRCVRLFGDLYLWISDEGLARNARDDDRALRWRDFDGDVPRFAGYMTDEAFNGGARS